MTYNEKQLEIITAAEQLFSERGFSGTSVREIADAANVNVAMISYYFNSKEKLLEAIFTERTLRSTERLDKLIHDDRLEPFQKIEVLIDDYISKLIHQHKFYKLMYFEQVLEKNQPIKDLLKQLKVRNGALITKLIEDGQRKKAFRKNIDIGFLIHTMIGTIMHSYMNIENYRAITGLADMPDEEFTEEYKKRLKKYMKHLFKSTIGNEA